MKLYKFTNANNTTRNNTLWGKGITNAISKEKRKPELYTNGVIHAYKDLNLALIISDKHGFYPVKRIWEAKGIPVVEDWDKVGVYKLITTKEVPIPDWYTYIDTRCKVFQGFASLCAKAVLPLWEDEYPKDDRPRKAIEAVELYYTNPTSENMELCREYATNTYNAAYDVYVDNDDTNAYNTARAAYYAANVTNIYDDILAAYSANDSAEAAIKADPTINLADLANQAVNSVTNLWILRKLKKK